MLVLGLGSRPEFATIPPMHHRVALAWAGALGAAGVVLGALGAHALKGTLAASGMGDAWQTAVIFQLVHACALLGFAGWLRPMAAPPGRCAEWAIRLWILGTLLFSGSLYWLALGGPRGVGPLTPLGGLALIAGWILAAGAAFAG
jgi:uncharacterized membrane protein YgdD (TMEM256/DUF423 family)